MVFRIVCSLSKMTRALEVRIRHPVSLSCLISCRHARVITIVTTKLGKRQPALWFRVMQVLPCLI